MGHRLVRKWRDTHPKQSEVMTAELTERVRSSSLVGEEIGSLHTVRQFRGTSA